MTSNDTRACYELPKDMSDGFDESMKREDGKCQKMEAAVRRSLKVTHKLSKMSGPGKAALHNQAFGMDVSLLSWTLLEGRAIEACTRAISSGKQSGSSKGDGCNRERWKFYTRFSLTDLNCRQRPAADGIWILVGIVRIRAWAAQDFSGYDRYEFSPAMVDLNFCNFTDVTIYQESMQDAISQDSAGVDDVDPPIGWAVVGWSADGGQE